MTRGRVGPTSAVARVAHGGSITVAYSSRLVHRLLSLAGSEQHGRAQCRVGAGAGERETAGGAALVVRKLDDRNAIVLAEGEEELVHPAAERFHRLAQFRRPILRRLQHRLDGGVLICPLIKIKRHGILPEARGAMSRELVIEYATIAQMRCRGRPIRRRRAQSGASLNRLGDDAISCRYQNGAHAWRRCLSATSTNRSSRV